LSRFDTSFILDCVLKCFARGILSLALNCKPLKRKKASIRAGFLFGAGDGTQTRDLCLGKAALYQLSYSRARIVIEGGNL
jgi:hypothetical protein